MADTHGQSSKLVLDSRLRETSDRAGRRVSTYHPANGVQHSQQVYIRVVTERRHLHLPREAVEMMGI